MHGFLHCLCRLRYVNIPLPPPLMKQIPAKHLSRNAVYLAESLVPVRGQFGKSLASGIHHPRTPEINPFPLRNKLQSVYPDIFLKVRRNKSHIPLKYRCHPQLFHTGDNAPSHLGHFIYLLLAQRTTVAFQVSHIPPGGKCRIRDKTKSFFPRIPQACQKIFPCLFQTRRYQRMRKPIQRQKINLPLPSVPIPKSRRIRKGAVIIGKNDIPRAFYRNRTGGNRQRGRKRYPISVPRKMDLGYIL